MIPKNAFFAVMYHYVRPYENSRLRYLNVKSFERQLDYFSTNWGIVNKEDWNEFRLGGKHPNGVLLTFDDGLKDHVKFVAPILKERNLFGIFYACTNPLISQPLTVHLVHSLLSQVEPEKIWAFLVDAGVVRRYLNAVDDKTKTAYSRHDSEEVVKEIKRIFNWCSSELGQDEMIFEAHSSLTHLEVPDFVKNWYLDEGDLKTLIEGGFEIGSHTCSHKLLSNLSEKREFVELSSSRHILQEVTNSRIDSFCFPFGGKKSYLPRTLSLLEKIGYKESFSVESVEIPQKVSGLRRYELPRFDCNFFPYGKS